MRKLFFLFVALLATTTLWAQSFQSGDLYYNITSSSAPYTVEVTCQEYWSFSNYSSLTTATIPEIVTHNGITYSVTSIGNSAFEYCTSLTSITIPNSVTSIGDFAFYACSSLTSITIPENVTSIGYNALNSIGIYKDESNWENDVLYISNCLIEARSNISGSYTIKDNTRLIANTAFSGCRSLTSITIPESVTSIGKQAFYECSSLTSITIPESVTSIGNDAFSSCSSLTSVTIPNSVTSIGSRAFEYCSSLTSITIPESVTSIGVAAFAVCSSLTSMTVENGNTHYDSRENCNAIIETATNTLIAGCHNTIIPNSVTSIGEGVFAACSSTSITIPNSVTSIGGEAFAACSSLIFIAIPNSVTSIGYFAFTECSSLTSITIPNSIMSIGDYAFTECSSLTTVICKAIEIPELGMDVFIGMPLAEATLYVPAQSLDDYKAADQWKDFGTILPIEEEPEDDIELQDIEMTILFTNSEDNDSEIYRETFTIKVPTAPTIAGFTFLYWQPVAEPITNEITIQAIYEADNPTSVDVYTNPANPAQKLLRNGQVYILQDGKTYNAMGQEL